MTAANIAQVNLSLWDRPSPATRIAGFGPVRSVDVPEATSGLQRVLPVAGHAPTHADRHQAVDGPREMCGLERQLYEVLLP